MKQVLQDLENGLTYIEEAPSPNGKTGSLVINTSKSLISGGTEKMLVDFGRSSYLEKAKQQPDKVKMVKDKIKTDGLKTTIEAVRSKLAQPIPLGYCNVGIVSEVGKGVDGFKVGDRVVSNGPHAEVVRVFKNLCAKIPENVDDETASFTVVSSIGLQAIRHANPTIGETFTVLGVGLIGLLIVQILKASGCRVLAIDYDSYKLEIAKSYGAMTCDLSKGEDPVEAAKNSTRNRGVDGVIITASTESSDPISQAANMSRKKGRIIMVGVTGMKLNRSDFYQKELIFQVSCGYGYGRGDKNYEEDGNDYPFGLVRWTEQRNFEAVLDMMSNGSINVKKLISNEFSISDATSAYEELSKNTSIIGIILNHDSQESTREQKIIPLNINLNYQSSDATVGFIGAGNYASRILIPSFKKGGAMFHTISTSGGINGVIHGKKYGFKYATTETIEMINNLEINTIVVATQHDSHCKFVVESLNAGKNIFVEKPLVLSYDELNEVQEAYNNSEREGTFPRLMVGYNRRFSPHIIKMKSLLDTIKEPKSFLMLINSGEIASESWVQDSEVGGGRIIGEACHFVDLMRFLSGSKIISIQARKIIDYQSHEITDDKAVIILGFEDGSFGTIHYLANGSSQFPKERIEVFTAGKVLQLDNFINLKGYGWPNFHKMKLWKQDKGQNACSKAFLNSLAHENATPIPVEEVFEVAKCTLDIAKILKNQ